MVLPEIVLTQNMERIMAMAEIILYLAIYLGVMAVGLAFVAKRQKNAAMNDEFSTWPANENLEKPGLGTGLGPVLPANTYVKNTTSRRAG
jgi:hypothetical protein